MGSRYLFGEVGALARIGGEEGSLVLVLSALAGVAAWFVGSVGDLVGWRIDRHRMRGSRDYRDGNVRAQGRRILSRMDLVVGPSGRVILKLSSPQLAAG